MRKKRSRLRSFITILLLIIALILFLHYMSGFLDRYRTADLSELPDELAALYKRNPETLQFVEAWPGDPKAEYKLEVEEGTVPLLLQWDTRWGYAPYHSDGLAHCIGLSGCGPTVLSMAAIALTGDATLDPRYIAAYAAENDYSTVSDGTKWTLFTDGVEPLGLQSEELPLWETQMVSTLQNGALIVCSVGPGDFTTKGHFILLCGYSDSLFEIRDPNSISNSAKKWDYETLSPQIRALWAITKK